MIETILILLGKYLYVVLRKLSTKLSEFRTI